MTIVITRGGFRKLLFIACLLSANACSNFIAAAKNDLANELASGILNQDDPETVRSGMPAYLILISSLVEGDPDNQGLLLGAARLYSSYASVFVDDPERKTRLARKARDYATAALCLKRAEACEIQTWSLEQVEAFLAKTTVDDVPELFALGSTWSGWIQASPSDWTAVASLSIARALIVRVIALDESYQSGDPHMYMGVMHTLLPPSLGGKPELGRASFETAIKLSSGTNLMAKVLMAEKYARLVFDRDLHDRLLNEVIEADASQPGLTLVNTMAQIRARELLESGREYF